LAVWLRWRIDALRRGESLLLFHDMGANADEGDGRHFVFSERGP
jgi:hypothetical protein